MYRFILTASLLFAFFLRARAFTNPAITRLGIQQGLSNNSVRCIYQDHNGLMWFGTYDGLNRYDGYAFKVYRNKINDTGSIPHNYIYAIQEDRHNNLWIGTGQGVALYNSVFDRFTPVYYIPYKATREQKITFNVSSLACDAAGNVFIGSNGWGLLVKKDGKDDVVQLPLKTGTTETSWYNVQSICIDRQQRVWIFISGTGLCLYDYKTNSIKPVNNVVKTLAGFASDGEGNIWMGTDNGLYKYVIATNTFTQHFTEDQQQLSSNTVSRLCADQQHNIWIGTMGGGVNILNTQTGKLDYLLPGESQHELSSESVNAILVDKESRVWIGTLKGGIDIIDMQKGRFQTIIHNPVDRNSLINNFVFTFYEDAASDLWIGTDGGGMSIWNRHKNRFINYNHQPGNSRSLSSNSVSCIKQDYLGNTWVATFGGGINKFNAASGTFERYACINDRTGEENKNVLLLYEDRDRNFFATTFGSGKLYQLNRSKNKFEVFDNNLNDLISITEDHKGNLWAGNSHQLIKIDKVNRQHAIYEIDKPVRAIYEDRHQNLWLGTEGGGLILFNSTTGRMAVRYASSDGLTNNAVLNILEDDGGFLWVSTFNGLSKFDPAKKTFQNFYQSDGLQSNQFSYNAALKLRSGEMAFGGINGFTLFLPQHVNTRSFMPPVLFSEIRINNKPVSEIAPYITSATSDRILQLKIPYNEAILSVHFTALEYSSPEKIKYQYFLQNWDKDWNYAGNTRTINYNNITEGSYILRVRSTNAEGVWNRKEAMVNIIILPPWYRTYWAYLLYISVVASIAYTLFRYKTRQARLEYEIKLAHVNAEKEKEINEKRHDFFTNISHEFRTPLTLIINPVKDLLGKGEMPDEEKELSVVYRNARRLLSLVDQLLIFRKADVEADKMQFAKLNFYNLCREVYLCFVQQAKANHQTYLFECDNAGLELYADREKMEIVLYNLLSNAIKFTPAGGTIVFSIYESGNNIQIAIKDTGCGFSKEAGARLFDKFYQAPSKGPMKPGFGIGLYLVRHFIEGHKGTVSFESQEGTGTIFFIALQKGKDHLAGQTILNETPNEPVFLEELADAAEEEQQDIKDTKLDDLVSDKQMILIVDDDRSIRQYLQQILGAKYDVIEAVDGKEAWKMVQKQFPDLVISDIRMEGMDGMELCKKIKQDTSLNHIPVILITGTSASETELQSIEEGADLYITKPFDKHILLARVENLFKTRNELRKYFFNEITLRQNTLKISVEYREFLDRCIAIVERHLNDEQFSIKILAKEIGMSHSNLYKRIRLLSGQSITNFIRYIRLRKAAELMIKDDCNVNQAAFQVGISDIKYFRLQFNKLFGMNPSEYIKKYRNSFNGQYNIK